MPRPLELRVDSTVYVYATVTVDHDITGVPISVALPTANQSPASSDFQSAEEVSTTQTDGRWTMRYRILVGPDGALSPATGLRDWTVKLTDSPEAPVFKAGQVRITTT